jgi:hypothetical protein
MARRAARFLGSRRGAIRPSPDFKARYRQAERRRAALTKRLAALNEAARAHSGYLHTSTLLNRTFRKASVAQRLAVLQAAEWLIDVLETLTIMM